MARAKSKQPRKPRPTPSVVNLLARELVHEYVLEMMLAHQMAALPADAAMTIMHAIGQLDGMGLSESSPMRKIASAFSRRVIQRAAILRAERGLMPSSKTRN
jgi:hypothetical protein